MNKTKLFAVVFASILFATGCKTASVQQTGKTKSKSENKTAVEPAKPLTPEELTIKVAKDRIPPPIPPPAPADNLKPPPFPSPPPPPVDRRTELLKMIDDAKKSGYPTEKYERELEKLEPK